MDINFNTHFPLYGAGFRYKETKLDAFFHVNVAPNVRPIT